MVVRGSEALRGGAALSTRTSHSQVNLVGNALKFTDNGTVEINLNSGTNGIEILIKDTGCGIPEKDHESIFQDYEQSCSHNKEGTGLGLAIASKLSQLVGSGVRLVDSTPKGSTFSFGVKHFQIKTYQGAS